MSLMKTIALDFDDVVMNFNSGFVNFHNLSYGTNLTYEELVRYDDWEVVYGCSKEAMVERAREFYRSPHHLEVVPILGAVEAILKLASRHRLEIVTSRPETVREQVLTWLNRHLPETFKEIHFTNGFAGMAGSIKRAKSEICREIGAHAFVDDALTHAEDVARAGIPVLLPDRPWNRDRTPDGVIRVKTWDDIVKWTEKNL